MESYRRPLREDSKLFNKMAKKSKQWRHGGEVIYLYMAFGRIALWCITHSINVSLDLPIFLGLMLAWKMNFYFHIHFLLPAIIL